MPVLIPVGVWIGTALVTTVVVIAQTVALIIASLSIIVSTIFVMTVSAAAFIITSILSPIFWGMKSIWGSLTKLYAVVMPTLIKVYKAIATFSKALAAGMTEFLEIIHFNLILKAHNLAMIFSKDYQEMMRKIYRQIAEISEALGLGAGFINLALNDSRNLVLDVSSLMGRPYDIGQITWLKSTNRFFKYVNQYGKYFENNPGHVFEVIAEMIDKPHVDAKAGFQKNIITFLDNTIKVADNLADKTVKLREDLDQAILHLPKEISRPIYDEINPHLERFDRFIAEEYKPVSRDVTKAIHVLTDTTIRNTDKLSSLTQSILNPGDLLGNIDNLAELERIRQEGKIAEIAGRAPRRAHTSINKMVESTHQGLKKIYAALIEERVEPPYHVPEVRGLRYAVGVIPEIHKSWFIGDF